MGRLGLEPRTLDLKSSPGLLSLAAGPAICGLVTRIPPVIGCSVAGVGLDPECCPVCCPPLNPTPRVKSCVRQVAELVAVGGGGVIHRAEHWDAAYGRGPHAPLSRHQEEPRIALELIEALAIPRDGAIVDVGGAAVSRPSLSGSSGGASSSVGPHISARALEATGHGGESVA